MYKKAPWILQRQYEFNEIERPSSSLEFLSGEKLLYLGRKYRLKLIKEDITKPSLQFVQNKFIATIPVMLLPEQKSVELRQTCIDWYKQRGMDKIQQRIQLYSRLMEVFPQKLILKDQEMRWGSCGKNGVIMINWRIVMAPMRIIDYVVVHEMAHLRYPDHSEDFWRYVRSVLPDYESRKEWLRIHGPTLTL